MITKCTYRRAVYSIGAPSPRHLALTKPFKKSILPALYKIPQRKAIAVAAVALEAAPLPTPDANSEALDALTQVSLSPSPLLGTHTNGTYIYAQSICVQMPHSF